MRRLFVLGLAVCIVSGVFGKTASAAEVAVVDTVKVFAQSEPGKEATEHLRKVTAILQKGMDDMAARYKGKEESPEAQREMGQARALLQQELAGQEQLVSMELNRCLTEAVAQWRSKNKGFVLVLPKGAALGADGKIEVTRAVLAEMDKIKANFPALPEVRVKNAEDAAAAGATEKKN